MVSADGLYNPLEANAIVRKGATYLAGSLLLLVPPRREQQELPVGIAFPPIDVLAIPAEIFIYAL